MRILLVTPYLPRLDARHAGGKLAGLFVREMGRRHDLEVVSRLLPGDEHRMEEIAGIVHSLHTAGKSDVLDEQSQLSALGSLASIRRLTKVARSVLAERRFDVVQIDHTEVGLFWPGDSYATSVLTCVDVISKPARRRWERSEGVRRPGAWISWKLQQALERRTLRKFDGVLTLSELDAQWARRLWSDVRVTTLRYAGGIGFTGVRRDEVEGRVGYLGTLNRSANTEGVRWLLDDVWPRVLERQPGAELQIAGVGASESLVRTIESVEGACFLGEVDDVERFYKSCQVFVAPVPIGGGVIVKVLDGLASGTALVTTTYGNEGIGGRDGRDLIVADSKEGFAAAVVRLLTDSSERSRMGASGLDFVRREFPDSKLVDQVEQFYRELLAVCQGRRGRSTGEP